MPATYVSPMASATGSEPQASDSATMRTRTWVYLVLVTAEKALKAYTPQLVANTTSATTSGALSVSHRQPSVGLA